MGWLHGPPSLRPYPHVGKTVILVHPINILSHDALEKCQSGQERWTGYCFFSFWCLGGQTLQRMAWLEVWLRESLEDICSQLHHISQPLVTTADFVLEKEVKKISLNKSNSTLFTMKMPVFTVGRKSLMIFPLYLLVLLLIDAFSRSRTLMKFSWITSLLLNMMTDFKP